jgi:hypothetical protein
MEAIPGAPVQVISAMPHTSPKNSHKHIPVPVSHNVAQIANIAAVAHAIVPAKSGCHQL